MRRRKNAVSLAVSIGCLVVCSVLVPLIARGEWQEHQIRQGDGQGGWVARRALRQVLKHPDSEFTMPFGLAQMDNGEIAILVSREKANSTGGRIFEPNIAFSKDGGATWSDFQAIPGTKGRPQFLHWLGGGRLSFITETFDGGKPQRIFSRDYGRTWNESVDQPLTKQGRGFGVEGNGWIDRDESGAPEAILEIGYHLEAGKTHPTGDFTAVFRRSVDGGKTWIDEVSPPQWKFTVEHNGKKWLRGVSEGSVVRAANGDLVAALRTDMPPKYFDGPHDDSLEGTAVSISKDDGKTWSELKFLFEAGRHHANLQRLPNGDLVCTLIVRDDIQAGKLTEGQLTSRRRGCDALISKDHGQSWNLDQRYELDGFEFLRADGYWVDGVCGHIGAVVLNDGHILSVYGHYPVGAVLMKWKPDADVEPAGRPKVSLRTGPEASEAPYLIGYTEGRNDLPDGQFANWVTNRACIVRADGTRRRVLAEDLTKKSDSWTQFAGWSPDGRQAVILSLWESSENAAWERAHRTFRMTEGWLVDSCLLDLATGEIRNLTAVDRVSIYNTGLFFLPGGSGFGFTPLINGVSKPYVMDVDGRNKRDVSGQGAGFAYGYTASPDGERISYHENYQVYVSNVDGSDKRRIETGNPFNFVPLWSPDGEWLLFVSGEHYDCHPHLVKKDGTGLRKLADRGGYRGVVERLKHPDFHSESSDVPVWAADGKAVYYTAKVGESIELMRVSLDGSVEQLTESRPGVRHYHPSPSPDGQWILFGSDRSGVMQLYVARANGADTRVASNVPAGSCAMHGHWQPVAR